VLKTDAASGFDRVKLYTLPDGTTKGDALVGFLKPGMKPDTSLCVCVVLPLLCRLAM